MYLFLTSNIFIEKFTHVWAIFFMEMSRCKRISELLDNNGSRKRFLRSKNIRSTPTNLKIVFNWRYELAKKERKLILKDVIQRHRFFWFGDLSQNSCETIWVDGQVRFLSFYLSETFYLEKSPEYIVIVQKPWYTNE